MNAALPSAICLVTGDGDTSLKDVSTISMPAPNVPFYSVGSSPLARNLGLAELLPASVVELFYVNPAAMQCRIFVAMTQVKNVIGWSLAHSLGVRQQGQPCKIGEGTLYFTGKNLPGLPSVFRQALHYEYIRLKAAWVQIKEKERQGMAAFDSFHKIHERYDASPLNRQNEALTMPANPFDYDRLVRMQRAQDPSALYAPAPSINDMEFDGMDIDLPDADMSGSWFPPQ